MRATRSLKACRLPLMLAACLAPGLAAADDGWDWHVVPYLWLPSITVDVDSRFSGGGDPNDSFPEALDDLDAAFLGRIEGRGDRFGVFADFLYMGLGGGEDYSVASTDVDLDATVIDLALIYSPGDDRDTGFDLFGGMRYIDLEADVEIDPTNDARPNRSVDASESFTDFLLGARYTGAMGSSGNWFFSFGGDASWGDTEGTWSANGMLHYRVGMGSWLFGYRYLTGELEPNRNAIDINLSGPIVGFAFKF